MKLHLSAVLAALVAGTAAVEYRAMTTRPAVLRKRDPDCVDDACLQAVQQTNFCTCIRQGREDCSSYFVTTITPEPEIVWSTSYVTLTSSSTESLTVTTVIDETASETESVTASETLTESTSTVAVTSINQGKGKAKKRSVNAKQKAKRGDLRRIPYYAQQVCGGGPGYESACACMGVYSSFVMAPVPTVTLTTTESTYSPTVTDSTTVSTEATTTTVTTQTVTQTVSTETATAVATAQGPFWMQVSSDSGGTVDVAGNYATLQYTQAASPYWTMNFDTTQTSEAAAYYIDAEGYLRSPLPSDDNANYWSYYDSANSAVVLELNSYEYITESPYLFVRCTITPDTNALVCGGRTNPPDGSEGFRDCSSSVDAASFGATSLPEDTCLSFQVVAVPYEAPVVVN
ncbi:hypothetical protein CONLIGDRAFT_634902 [Coniochaeta ligniaria NRRL 30616]|uniref:Apple domain-containing protein n=1 Tax=Coniochaeta ligniaria NRRL 30616 TaxID=1408157 RepID=A0A1J7JGC8_9PEZI|nr:hypothetical protein CONLIGDRAFT_634902 [Coniochaeta ligniaria NRRL 30616]